MSVWPAKSWSAFVGPVTQGGGAVYEVLGPFPEGSVLRRFRCFYWNTDGGQLCSVGISVGPSGQAGFDAWSNGLNVVSRSSARLGTQPFVVFYAGDPSSGWFEVPFGAKVQSGSRFGIVRVHGATAPGVLYVLTTVDVVEAHD